MKSHINLVNQTVIDVYSVFFRVFLGLFISQHTVSNFGSVKKTDKKIDLNQHKVVQIDMERRFYAMPVLLA